MNSLNSFAFGGKPIRVVLVAGEPKWVAKDIADALDYKSSNRTTIFSNVPEEWKGSNPIATPGGNQLMQTLTEQGLYFFLGRSDKPKALPMQKWVAGEVLPSIRKTGAYSLPGKSEQEARDLGLPPNVRVQLSAALTDRWIRVFGIEGTREIYERIGPFFQNLPGVKPRNPQEAFQPTLSQVAPTLMRLVPVEP